MKILMTTDTLGGVWDYSLELTRGLAQFNVDVALATMGAPLTQVQRQDAEAIHNLFLYESDFRLEWMADPWRDVALSGDWLLGLYDQVEPDLVHLNQYAQAALPWQAPVLVAAHSCVWSWMHWVRGCSPDRSWDPYYFNVSRGLSSADFVVAPTQWMLDELHRHYERTFPARVIHNGYTASSALRHSDREPFVLSAGRIWDEAKNVSLLNRIAEQIAWPIYVAGDTRHPDGGEFLTACNIKLLGKRSPQELRELMARASVYVLPAKYEPFGLSALEAAWHGCPLVLGDIGSLSELWDGAAVFADPHVPAAWVERINHLIRNVHQRTHYSRLAWERAQKYSRARMVGDYLRLYQQLMDMKALHPKQPMESKAV